MQAASFSTESAIWGISKPSSASMRRCSNSSARANPAPPRQAFNEIGVPREGRLSACLLTLAAACMMTSQVKERSMLTRRHFVIGSLSPLAFAVPAHAAPHCISDAKLGGQLCKSFISVTDAYQETYYARHEPTAIWIACVAVVFASYGHVIQQPRIAEEAYGGFDKIALEKGFAVSLPLARTWKN